VAEGKPFLWEGRNIATDVSTLTNRGTRPALRVGAESGPPLAVQCGVQQGSSHVHNRQAAKSYPLQGETPRNHRTKEPRPRRTPA
jgi:hypothetical protein